MNQETTENKTEISKDERILLRPKAGVNVWLLNPQILEQMSLPTGVLAAGILV